MTVDEVLGGLEAVGREQTRKIYRRHGVVGDLYGVSYADLKGLAKRIKVDQPLAEALWASGVHEARVLATMVADPASIGEAVLEGWAATLDDHVIAEALAGFVARTPHARALLERWTVAEGEWVATAGWTLLAHLAMDDGALPEAALVRYLATIEREIHARPNWVRYAMNGALIAIGGRGGALEERALAAAGRIGPVAVDHGQTSCRTPDAVATIAKVRARARRSA